MANDVVELWDFGGDGGDGFVLIEGERSVVHDGLVVIRRVLIGDEVIVVFVEVVFKSCGKCHVDTRKATQRVKDMLLVINPLYGKLQLSGKKLQFSTSYRHFNLFYIIDQDMCMFIKMRG